jgi:hypothetical protein
MFKDLKIGESKKVMALADSHQFTFAIEIDRDVPDGEKIADEFKAELDKAAQKVAHKYKTKAKQVFNHG